jgi:hypothetical protein
VAEVTKDEQIGQPRPHPQFATWMREFRLGQDHGPALAQRWAGVTSIAAFAKHDEVEALVRLALKSRQQPATAEFEKIVGAFRDEDSSFSVEKNARELEVLAAITLVQIAQTIDDIAASTAALAITTSLVGGARTPQLPLALRDLGEHALKALSIARSIRPSPSAPLPSTELTFETAAAKARAQFDAIGLGEALVLAGNSASASLNAVQSKNAVAISTLETRLLQQDEELQMLWWLIGGRSEYLACDFDDVPPAVQPLVFAKEIAEHTKLLPGPVSLRAILSRAGISDRERLVLSAAIGACKPEWLAGLTQEKGTSPVTCPIHYAIQRQIETGLGTDWIAGWAAAAELPKDLTLTPLSMAELFYRERLLLGVGGWI